jgi:maltose O-acetyltransferase
MESMAAGDRLWSLRSARLGGKGSMGSEKEKMLAGELYRASDPELVAERRRCRSLLHAFNAQPDEEQRLILLRDLIGRIGTDAFIQPPFACDYGSNISIGEHAFINFNCVILDCAQVSIGDRTQIAPGVQLLAADHPRDAETRRDLLELARPISIGSNVWIGGAAIVLPGVSIGEDSIIGAGSVVTRDVPSGVLAFGNPCRVVREL